MTSRRQSAPIGGSTPRSPVTSRWVAQHARPWVAQHGRPCLAHDGRPRVAQLARPRWLTIGRPLTPGGGEAAEANRKLVEGQTVRLELDVQERDKYGRLPAYVYVGDMMVNAEMVAQGYAQIMTIPPNVKYQELFLKLQREARLLQLGLWRGSGPPPPERGASSTTPPPQVAQTRPGVPPQDAWTCPLTHPIKGNFTTNSGERCIYHMQGGQFFGKTKPERCYASGEEARQDGCRASRR
jgi:micrococcal nuclease